MDTAEQLGGMASNRKLAILAIEILLVALAVFLLKQFQVVVAGHDSAKPAPVFASVAAGVTASAGNRVHTQTSDRPSSPPSLATPSTANSQACDFEPMLPAQGRRDGRYRIDAALNSAHGTPARAFMTAAKDALAANRLRDAEVALIVSCRLAGMSHKSPSLAVATAQAKLAQVYRDYVRNATSNLPGIKERTYELLVDSLAGFTNSLGAQSSRTRVAAQELSAFNTWQTTGVEPELVADPMLAAGYTVILGGPPPLGTLCGANPSMPPCSNPHLGQLAEDLARLRQQAAAISGDAPGFAERMRAAQARRDACTDMQCLENWYSARRQELFGEFSQGRAMAATQR